MPSNLFQTYNNGGLGFTLPGNTGNGTGILPVTVTNGVPISNDFQTIFQVGGNCTLGSMNTIADINGNNINLTLVKINGDFFA